MDTLDMEDRIVKLEQWQREHTAKHIKDMETHHTDVLLHGYGKADFREAVEKYRQETLAAEKRLEIAMEAFREIGDLYSNEPSHFSIVDADSIAKEAMEKIKNTSKPDSAPCDDVEEKPKAHKVQRPDSW